MGIFSPAQAAINYLVVDFVVTSYYLPYASGGGYPYGSVLASAFSATATIANSCPVAAGVMNAPIHYYDGNDYASSEGLSSFSNGTYTYRTCVAGVPSTVTLTATPAGIAAGATDVTVGVGTNKSIVVNGLIESKILLPDGAVIYLQTSAYGCNGGCTANFGAFRWNQGSYGALPVIPNNAYYVMGF